MLFDLRTYTCKPGRLKAHLALYEEFGLGPQSKNLGEPFAYLVTETGNPNAYVHIWAYENAGDREAKRAALWADPEWLAYTKASAELGALEKQENVLMNPVDFYEAMHFSGLLCSLGQKFNGTCRVQFALRLAC